MMPNEASICSWRDSQNPNYPRSLLLLFACLTLFLKVSDGVQLSEKQLLEKLAQCTASLELQSAELEDLLLAECGRFAIGMGQFRDFPACVNEQKCKAKMGDPLAGWPGYGFVLQQWMTQAEFDRFIRLSILPPRRICVLCHRVLVAATLYSARDMGKKNVTLDPRLTLVQQYTNTTDCPGGYKKECCVGGPTKERFEGLYGALVQHRSNQLAVVRDKETGRRSLDQVILCCSCMFSLSDV